MTQPPPSQATRLAPHLAPHQAVKLRAKAIARSGDKGQRATLTVIAQDLADFAALERLLSSAQIADVYRDLGLSRIDRHVLPHLGAVHFVLHDALGGGVTRSLALDAHGKTLSAAVLDLDWV
jgi:hypothetical protein